MLSKNSFKRVRGSKGTRLAAIWMATPLVLFAGWMTGCGAEATPRAAIRGVVSYQGQAIADGNIAFFPAGATRGKPAGTAIVAGKYELSADEGPLVGTNRVEIQAYRKTGRKIPDLMGDVSQPNRPLIEEKVNVLPPQFNVDSKLERQIAAGENNVDFEL